MPSSKPISPADDDNNNGDVRSRKYMTGSGAQTANKFHSPGLSRAGSGYLQADHRIMSRSRKLQSSTQRQRTQQPDYAADETKPLANMEHGDEKDNFEYALIEKAEIP